MFDTHKSQLQIQKSLVTVGAPTYRATIVECYLRERTLSYNTDDEPKEHVVSAGLPENSVQGVRSILMKGR